MSVDRIWCRAKKSAANVSRDIHWAIKQTNNSNSKLNVPHK